MKFKTFAELAKHLGIKEKKPNKQKVQKCQNCGGPLRHIEGTNVTLCENPYLRQATLNGKKVQVFGICHNTILAPVN